MSKRLKRSWRDCCRPAFTLVEVVASLMLLGTLLVAILAAHRQHVRQIRCAESRLAAVTAMDELLAKWSGEGSWGATQNEGEFEGLHHLKWRWTVTSSADLSHLGASVAHLEAIDRDGGTVCQVDLLTPDILPGTK